MMNSEYTFTNVNLIRNADVSDKEMGEIQECVPCVDDSTTTSSMQEQWYLKHLKKSRVWLKEQRRSVNGCVCCRVQRCRDNNCTCCFWASFSAA